MRRLGGLVLVFAVVAAACTSDSDAGEGDSAATTAASTSRPPATLAPATTASAGFQKPYGGEIRHRMNTGIPVQLNPLLGGGGVEFVWWAYSGGVWRIDANEGKLVPDLVTELPSTTNGGLRLNPDGSMTVRYEIDPDALWSDGVPVSGDDFAFTYDVVTGTVARIEAARESEEPEIVATDCGNDVTMADLEVLGSSWYEGIVPGSVRAGPKTFEYTLAEASGYSEQLFWRVVPKHAVEGTDFVRDWIDRAWPSAGPFVIESFTPRLEMGMVRNENYWRIDPESGQRLPYLDRFVLSEFLDEAAARLPEEYRRFHRIFNECGFEEAVAAVGLRFGDPDDLAFVDAAFQEFTDVQIELYLDGVLSDLPLQAFDERVSRLQGEGLEFRFVDSGIWEHLAFHYGDNRLRSNQDSLVEHLEFRTAVAHAIDRDKLAAEALGVPVEPIDSLVDAFSAQSFGAAWGIYDHDPEEARRQLSLLCDRLARDCEADPPALVFTWDAFRPDRRKLGELLAEMLGAVGITVELEAQELFQLVGLGGGCQPWEMTTFAWASNEGFAPLLGSFLAFDPADNVYAWGIPEVTGIADDPDTPDCDESLIWNQGPSAARNEFTERYGDLVSRVQQTADPASYLPAFAEMEDILAERVVMIPLYRRPFASSHDSDVLGGYGYEWQLQQPQVLWNVDRWYRADLSG